MKLNFKCVVIVLGLISCIFANAQKDEKIDTIKVLDKRIKSLEDAIAQNKKLKISGYVHSQYQYSQIDINGKPSQDLKVGAGPNEKELIDGSMGRFGIRRGRLKATYSDAGCTGVVYIDALEKGVLIKEAYVAALDPWAKVLTLKGGLFNRPFGYEIEYSSSMRESTERSRIMQTLFPDERDLGGTVTLQAPKTSWLNVFKLEAGLLSGNAIGQDIKSEKDFIAHLTFSKTKSNYKYGIGASMYNGTVYQATANTYSMSNNVFAVVGDSASTKNKLTARQYFGLDGQFVISTVAGITNIRSEYIFGTQPGTISSSTSYKNSTIPTTDYQGTYDIYIRKFAGGYIQLSQDIADTKHTIVVKYDWYDPNTAIAGNAIGAATTVANAKASSKVDIAYSTIGVGYTYRLNNNIKLVAYYDIPTNETSSELKSLKSDYRKNLADNLFTFRMQVKF